MWKFYAPTSSFFRQLVQKMILFYWNPENQIVILTLSGISRAPPIWLISFRRLFVISPFSFWGSAIFWSLFPFIWPIMCSKPSWHFAPVMNLIGGLPYGRLELCLSLRERTRMVLRPGYDSAWDHYIFFFDSYLTNENYIFRASLWKNLVTWFPVSFRKSFTIHRNGFFLQDY